MGRTGQKERGREGTRAGERQRQRQRERERERKRERENTKLSFLTGDGCR